MYFTLGKKQKKELYRGLSASNRSILWSLNTQPLPGVQIGTNGPLFPFDPDNETGFGFEGSYNEYLMGTDRYVKYASLHHKNFLFVYRTQSEWQFKAGLQHFVQWGGNSPQWGPQPSSARDYLRLITGQSGRENATVNDQLNTLGNHLGGYEFNVRKGFRDFSIELLYQHLFEDLSGQLLGNTPDGRYGIYFETNDTKNFINSVIYEFYYTKHQSQTTTGCA
ncbi:capsule assembly Wzi family protein [Antarcticibacterium sp. 1MA-6-2]|uniref:capsule assembly Wzi family protein n=1 Tax=Antarcticibacterium sp. 1MA-6-2 TaxID=2908210 RepID=UPI001F350E40|nr:capsule assembly Wzi family protein [Antarcticibacterium sp. 1MA-6-2]UJH89847.1 capsule assembly Wzi family protein [Antarcticibacterium sp. 1MA-6-2]